MIFIDGQNFYFGLRNAFPGKQVAFKCLAEARVAARQMVHVRYYNVHLLQGDEPERYRGHERFLSAISALPEFHVFEGRMVRRSWGTAEKGVDVQIAVHMVQQAYRDNYDVGILVSGDGDFEHVIKAVIDLGKHVENAYFTAGRSRALVNCFSRFTALDDSFMANCWL